MDTIWFALLITAALGIVALIETIQYLHEAHEAEKKKKSSKPVSFTAIDFTYSQEVLAKRIEKQAEELRQITEGRENNGGMD